MNPILENIELLEAQGIHAFIFEKEQFDMPLHVHPEYELTLILQSSGIRYVGNHLADFEPGDLVLLGSNLPHCWKNTSNPSKSKSLVIQWQGKLLHDHPIFDPIHQLMQQSLRGLKITENQEKIRDLMHDIVQVQGLRRYLLLIELLQLIAQNKNNEQLAGASYDNDANDHTTNRLEMVQSYVKDHFQEKIKLVDIASQLSMSEQAFSRFFSKKMNKPFFVFLNEYRINRASRFIFETDLQMSEIAYRCGYDSLPFFYKQFKKFKGYTPLEFRKMYQYS